MAGRAFSCNDLTLMGDWEEPAGSSLSPLTPAAAAFGERAPYQRLIPVRAFRVTQARPHRPP